MFVIKLRGGLGNQMFQYALAKSLMLSTGQQVFLDASFSHYSSETKRSYVIDCFRLDQKIQFIDTAHLPWVLRDPATDLLKKIFIKLRLRQLFTKDWRYVLEMTNGYNSEIKAMSGSIYLEGYWQTEAYFQDYRQSISADFSLVNTSPGFVRLADNIKASPAISLHVRRGDYATSPSVQAQHNLCSLEYYQQAIKLIKAKVSQPKFFVFSDDPDWALANLPLATHELELVYDHGLTDPEELISMSYCQHHIIANSSFSWWGAWLNQKTNKIVIAPKQWFRHGPAPLDLIPSSWLTI